MSCLWQSAARVATIVAVVLGLSGGAHAVTKLGAAKRVDLDAGASAIYWIGSFDVIRTGVAGFAAAWEENSKSESPNPIVYERILFRIFNNAFAPVAGPRAANVAGRRAPNFARLVPLGPSNAYLVYAGTRSSNASPDHPELRDAFGQTIALATGAATGARQLLNSTGNWDTLIPRASGLSDGRAVAAWFESDENDPAPGRFINSAGAPQPINLNFTCCGANSAQLKGLFPLGTGFVASYFRDSIFGGSNGLHGRVFKANGQPLGAAKFITANTTNPFIRSLSNNRIAVFTFEPLVSPANHFKLVVQLYNQIWGKLGGAKILIPDVATTAYLDVVPTLDGGVFLVRTLVNNGVYTRSVRRLNAAFTPVAPDYTFPSSGFDFFRVAALSNNRAVVLFRSIVGSRHRLFAQIVSY